MCPGVRFHPEGSTRTVSPHSSRRVSSAGEFCVNLAVTCRVGSLVLIMWVCDIGAFVPEIWKYPGPTKHGLCTLSLFCTGKLALFPSPAFFIQFISDSFTCVIVKPLNCSGRGAA